jgi:hypothetical protein
MHILKLASIFYKLAASRHLDVGQVRAAKEAIKDAEPEIRRWFDGLITGEVDPSPDDLITESIAEIDRIQPGGTRTKEAIPVEFLVAGNFPGQAAYNPEDETIAVYVDPSWSRLYRQALRAARSGLFDFRSGEVRREMGDPFSHVRSQLMHALSTAVHEFTHAGQVGGERKTRAARLANVYRTVDANVIQRIGSAIHSAREEGSQEPTPQERRGFVMREKENIKEQLRRFEYEGDEMGVNFMRTVLSLIANIEHMLIWGNLDQLAALSNHFMGKYFNTPIESEAFIAQIVLDFEEHIGEAIKDIFFGFIRNDVDAMVSAAIKTSASLEFYPRATEANKRRLINVILGAISRNTKKIQDEAIRQISEEAPDELDEILRQYPNFFEAKDLVAEASKPAPPGAEQFPVEKAASHISAF